MNLIILGPQGSGKGTQAQVIAQEMNIPHISTGDIFRDNIKNCTELGQKVKGYTNSGQLVPDEVTIEIVKDRLSKDDCNRGYLLDGFPRNIDQAMALDDFSNIDLAIEVDISDEESMKRIGGRRSCPKCGHVYHVLYKPPKNEGICDTDGETLIVRDDDKPEKIKERLAIYHSQTEPIVAFYIEQDKHVKIDGEQDIAKVTEDIKTALKELGS